MGVRSVQTQSVGLLEMLQFKRDYQWNRTLAQSNGFQLLDKCLGFTLHLSEINIQDASKARDIDSMGVFYFIVFISMELYE